VPQRSEQATGRGLRPSGRAPGLLIGEGVELPSTAQIGGNVVIHAGTELGEGVKVQDGAVLGKPVALGPRSRASAAPAPGLRVGDAAVICAGAVVLAGAVIAAHAVVGDQAHVRERATVGGGSVVGRGSAVDNDVRIGARVKVQSGCYLTAFTLVEDDVFLAPGVTTTNDHTMGRHDREHELRGATLRRACRVGGAAVLLPGVEVGEEAFVAAGALVTRDVPPRSVVMGVPARAVRDVPDEDLLERWP
jgi:acetyltransferase-like isoleucine patch superfamily enzyme